MEKLFIILFPPPPPLSLFVIKMMLVALCLFYSWPLGQNVSSQLSTFMGKLAHLVYYRYSVMNKSSVIESATAVPYIAYSIFPTNRTCIFNPCPKRLGIQFITQRSETGGALLDSCEEKCSKNAINCV